jgi:cytochrome c biogenesis protein CcmG/thiol:disulfide interchange protein DsbE
VNKTVLAAGLAVCVPLVAVLVVNLDRDTRSVTSPLLGQPAPPFSLVPAGGGEAVSLASLRGQPVVLNFWATWCVPCYEEHGVLTDAARRGGVARFLGVVYEDEEPRVMEFLKKEGAGYPSLLDPGGRTAIAYGVYGVPETFFVDAAGVVRDKHTGPLTAEALADRLARLRQ